MPHFFFDMRVSEHSDVIRGVRGCELPDVESARIEATELWKSIQKTADVDPLTLRIEVADAVGNVLADDIHLDFGRVTFGLLDSFVTSATLTSLTLCSSRP